MKRFYKAVSVVEVDGGFGIQLDGHNLRTPAKRAMILPTAALASEIAAEWDAQGEQVKPASMRLMRLISTALDRVVDQRDAVIDETLNYAGTDLLCYRASEPPDLIDRQTKTWQPLLDWASLRFDAPLRIVTGIVPVEQPGDSLRALRAVLSGMDALTLTGVADLTAAMGSLILALAIWDCQIDADTAFAASRLDEAFQNERWGEDYEAIDRRIALEIDVRTSARFLALLRVDQS